MKQPRELSRIVAAMSAMLIAVCLLTPDASAKPPTRAVKWISPGPFPVGCRTFVYVDKSRVDPTTKRSRQLVTEIWYPADDGARGKPRAKFSGFMMGKAKELVAAMEEYADIDIDAVDRNIKLLAVRNAKKRDGRFPLILFSHGNGGIRMQSIFLTEHLASHGYVVVAPDHTGNAAVTCLPEGIIVMNAKASLLAVEDRPRDLSFLIDEMTRQNAAPKGFLREGLDLTKIGATGHSYGGVTVSIVTRDKRVKAIMPLAGAAPGSLSRTTPMMLMRASQDKTIKESGNERFGKFFKFWPAEKWLLDFEDAGHFTFSDMHRILPDFGDGDGKAKRFDGSRFTYWDSDEVHQYIKAYGLAFFDAVLRDSKDARKLLDSPPLHPQIHKEYAKQRAKKAAVK